MTPDTSPSSSSHNTLAIERVRHPLQARHVQVLRRTQVTPGFVRLTLGGPALAGFASAGFDDHFKLILPQSGQERPTLPVIEDGRPVFAGPRPLMRDYTPLHYNAAAQEMEVEVALHDAGPATEWAAGAYVGQWVGMAGPRGSMVVPLGFDWHWLLGDETAVPAIARRLAELPATARAVVRIRLRNPADQRHFASAAQVDLAWVDALPAAVQALELPTGEGFIWAAGEHSEMAAVRQAVLAKPGVNAKRMRISAYWKQGASDHHEDLPNEAA